MLYWLMYDVVELMGWWINVVWFVKVVFGRWFFILFGIFVSLKSMVNFIKDYFII